MERKRQTAFTLVELLLGIALMGLLLTSLGPLWHSMRQVNDREMARQRCLAAAASELDSLARTGREIEPDQARRLWPNVRLESARSAGQGDWAGLTLLKVTARSDSHGREVRVDLARYVEGGP